MDRIANRLQPPYYAVIFTSERTAVEHGYGDAAARMMELVTEQPGFLGAESVRDADGVGITVSYWQSLEAIRAWKANEEHLATQRLGRTTWYSRYRLRICKVEWEYGFGG